MHITACTAFKDVVAQPAKQQVIAVTTRKVVIHRITCQEITEIRTDQVLDTNITVACRITRVGLDYL